MKYLAIGFLLFFCSSTVLFAQKKDNLIKRTYKNLFSTEKDSLRRASLMAVPAFGYSQETGLEYGLVAIYNFYIDKQDPKSKTSNINLTGTLTTKDQKNFKLLSDLWTKRNDYHIITEIRYKDFPYNFYGIGPNTWVADEDYIGQKFIRLRGEIEKKITPTFFAGVNVNYENFKYDDKVLGGIFENPNIIGRNGGQLLGFGVSALYDSRNNTTYTTKGFYSRVKYVYSPDFWKEDNFSGSQYEIDLRSYFPLHKSASIALQGLYKSTLGNNVPFYVMRDLGGDMTMRGYYLGRYRDKNYFTAQSELRLRLHPRFGITGFASTGTTHSKEYKARFVYAMGGGLRYFFNLEHQSTLRLDYAVGEKRPGEKRQSGFYLSLSEAF